MRIIAGRAKGSQIFAPKSRDTRPTQDRVRESLFNILQADVPGAAVLDLFAGSGALSLEAVSRGAASAVAVDMSSEAIQCIHRNVAKLDFQQEITVLKCDWQAALDRLQRDERRFDLVFLDPPYRMVETAGIAEQLKAAGLLEDGAILVIEHKKGVAPTMEDAFTLRTTRGYGDTEISFFDYQAQ